MEEEVPRILIVDDDLDFASLLSDVFSQASYEVEMTGDPTKVEALMRANSFSLVVTDLRMPGIDGFELAAKIRSINPDLPIIMVSGFLESKDREKIESRGIVALYEKPLSVFSLLKNAAKLISETKKKTKAKKRTESGAGADPSDPHSLGFPFKALPCQSEASHAFAESIYRLRNRRQNLCIVTPRGTPARALGEDFCRWTDKKEAGCFTIEPHEFSQEKLEEMVDKAREEGWKKLLLCIPETDRLNPAQQKQLAYGSRKGSVREQWGGHIQFVFMLSSDVESLYQEGILSDDLYLSMGGLEIHVPPLRECPEDIEYLARSTQTEAGTPLLWEDAAIRVLTEQDWPGNHSELRKVLLQLQKGDPAKPVRVSDVQEALGEGKVASPSRLDTKNISLQETLKACRSSYLHALFDLLGGESKAVASLARVRPELVEDIVKNQTDPCLRPS